MISVVDVKSGDAAIAPEAPAEEGWIFIRWDKDYTTVTEDMTVTALYIDLSTQPEELYFAVDGTTVTAWFDNLRLTHKQVYDIDDVPSEIRNTTTKVLFDESVGKTTVTSLSNAFANMSLLETVEGLKNINTAELTDVSFMFMNCSSLAEIDLNGFDLSGVTAAYGMFMGCSSLTTIRCDADYTALAGASSIGMFDGCTSLVGSKGTKYSTAHKDASYARPDGGTSAPGYFTGIDKPTDTETIEQDNGQSTKLLRNGILYILRNGILYILRNGILYILRNGKTYTIQGAELR